MIIYKYIFILMQIDMSILIWLKDHFCFYVNIYAKYTYN